MVKSENGGSRGFNTLARRTFLGASSVVALSLWESGRTASAAHANENLELAVEGYERYAFDESTGVTYSYLIPQFLTVKGNSHEFSGAIIDLNWSPLHMSLDPTSIVVTVGNKRQVVFTELEALSKGMTTFTLPEFAEASARLRLPFSAEAVYPNENLQRSSPVEVSITLKDGRDLTHTESP